MNHYKHHKNYSNVYQVLFTGAALMFLYHWFFGFEKVKVRDVSKEQVLYSRRIYNHLSSKVVIRVEYDLEGEADLFITSADLGSKFPILLRFTGKGDTLVAPSFSGGPVILQYTPTTATKGEVTIRIK